MPVTLPQIRAGLASNLSAHLTGIQVSAFMLANPTPPTIHLYPSHVQWQLAMGAAPLDEWTFTVQAFVGLVSDQGAQALLDTFLDPYSSQSVRTAVESNPTLGGIVADVNAIESVGYRVYLREGSPPVLGSEWTVRVLAGPT